MGEGSEWKGGKKGRGSEVNYENGNHFEFEVEGNPIFDVPDPFLIIR